MSGQLRVNNITNEDGTDGPTFNTTGSVAMPSGTTAERPGTPAAGMFRFNSETGQFEGYDGSAWGAIAGGGGVSEFLLMGA